MQRLAGQDAIFLYRETPTSMMHTLKVLIIKTADPNPGIEELHEQLKQNLNNNPILAVDYDLT